MDRPGGARSASLKPLVRAGVGAVSCQDAGRPPPGTLHGNLLVVKKVSDICGTTLSDFGRICVYLPGTINFNRPMKKFFSLLAAFLCCAATAWADAEITFDAKSHNFGTFTDEKPVTFTFTYKNTGDEPLVVHQVHTSCGCTVADYTKEPVLPGKTGRVTVTYDGKGRNTGKMHKTITVASNASESKVYLVIEGVMKRK